MMLGLVASLSGMMSVYSSRQITMSEALGIRRYSINSANTHLAEISLNPPLTDIQKHKIKNFFDEILTDNEVLKVRIWLKNGFFLMTWDDLIVFTEAKPGRKIQKLFSYKKDDDYTLSYEIRTANSDPGSVNTIEATRFEKKDLSPTRKHFAIFVPLFSTFSERVNYVVEVIKPAEIVITPMMRIRIMIWLITGLGLGFYPALLILANALYRRRKEKEIEIIKKKELEAISSMVVTINHEINQPLTGICSYADLLKKASKDNPDLLRYSEKIHEQSMRLSELIKRISDITRVEMTEYIDGTKMLDLSKSITDEDANGNESDSN